MPSQVVAIQVFLKAKPGFENKVRGAVLALIEPIRQKPNCLYYDFHQLRDDPTGFLSYEVWSSLQDFEEHLKSPFIMAMTESATEFLAQPLQYSVMYSVAPTEGSSTVPL
jgi:quinol monooxygenase YgiN